MSLSHYTRFDFNEVRWLEVEIEVEVEVWVIYYPGVLKGHSDIIRLTVES